MATPTDYEKCHRLGHAMDDIPVTKPAPFGVYLWVRCLRCGTERHDIIQGWGDGKLLSRRYYYPEGYRYAKGEKPSREEMRGMQSKRMKKNRRLRSVG